MTWRISLLYPKTLRSSSRRVWILTPLLTILFSYADNSSLITSQRLNRVGLAESRCNFNV